MYVPAQMCTYWENDRGVHTVSGGTTQTDDIFMYDPMGRLTFSEQCQPANCSGDPDMAMTATYNLLGQEASAEGQDYNEAFGYKSLTLTTAPHR